MFSISKTHEEVTMTDQPNPTPQGGRPTVGPAISVAYQEGLLAAIDAAANRNNASRAQWLRHAATAALPHDVLLPSSGIRNTLRDIDEDLHDNRQNAGDYDLPTEARVHHAVAYSTYASQMHTLIEQTRKAIPLKETTEAYKAAERGEPEYSEALAKAWGEVMAATRLDRLLEELSAMLPTDAYLLPSRAALDDPLELD
jgi:hypothetical protein